MNLSGIKFFWATSAVKDSIHSCSVLQGSRLWPKNGDGISDSIKKAWTFKNVTCWNKIPVKKKKKKDVSNEWFHVHSHCFIVHCYYHSTNFAAGTWSSSFVLELSRNQCNHSTFNLVFSGYVAPSVLFSCYTKWLVRPNNAYISLNHHLPKIFDNLSQVHSYVDRNLRFWHLSSTAFGEAFRSLQILLLTLMYMVDYIHQQCISINRSDQREKVKLSRP